MRKVIKEPEPVSVSLDNIFPTCKIYASAYKETVYKLHKVNSKWMFCSLSNSICGASGAHATAEKAIVANLSYKVFEFDNKREFLIWAIDIVTE